MLPREEESRKNGDSKGSSTGLGDDSKEKKSDGREERKKDTIFPLQDLFFVDAVLL